MKIKALIVEDKHDAVEGLAALLKEFCSGVEICGKAGSVKEAIEKCEKHRPDLIFLDIEMPGGNGFQLLDAFAQSGRPEIVFTTAHENYAIRALREGASDYLLKPIDVDELQTAIEKVMNRLANNASVFPVMEQKLRVLTTEGTVYISQREIIFIEADGRYCLFHLSDGKKLMAAKNIGEFEEDLAFNGFFRVHKSYLVNCEHIQRIREKGESKVELTGGHALEIARRKKADFAVFLKNTDRTFD